MVTDVLNATVPVFFAMNDAVNAWKPGGGSKFHAEVVIRRCPYEIAHLRGRIA